MHIASSFLILKNVYHFKKMVKLQEFFEKKIAGIFLKRHLYREKLKYKKIKENENGTGKEERDGFVMCE